MREARAGSAAGLGVEVGADARAASPEMGVLRRQELEGYCKRAGAPSRAKAVKVLRGYSAVAAEATLTGRQPATDTSSGR